MNRHTLNIIAVIVFILIAIVAIVSIIQTIVIHKTTLTSAPLRFAIAFSVICWLAAVLIEGILYLIALKFFVKR